MEVQCTEPVGDELQASNWKVWEGRNGGGAHNPSRGIAGNSSEPKRIVLPLPAAGVANRVIETIQSPKQ